MFVKSIDLLNFRNYKNETINFSDGVNIVHGKNAQGKTNLVESLYLLSCAKSFKTSKDVEMILHGEKHATVSANIQKDYGQEPQITLFMPLLEGVDGVEKMSKSLNNYIGISEDANIIYEKTIFYTRILLVIDKRSIVLDINQYINKRRSLL